MYKVELYARLRRACMVQGMSIREPPCVYDHIKWLAGQPRFPLYVVDNGRSLREDVKALTSHSGSRNARCYWVGASTTKSVVMMAKMLSESRTSTERVIIHTSPPPASK